jgi:hypothetical protein
MPPSRRCKASIQPTLLAHRPMIVILDLLWISNVGLTASDVSSAFEWALAAVSVADGAPASHCDLVCRGQGPLIDRHFHETS